MQNPTQYVVIIFLVAYIMFKRIRNAVNFQKYNPGRLVFRIVLYCLISLILLWIATLDPIQYAFDLGGMVLGLVLVYLAVRHIVFEKRNDGLYFRTHVWVEIAILTVFFIRLAWRFYKVYTQFSGMAPEVMSKNLRYASDPFTGIVFFLLCTYYIAYYTYIFRKGKEEMLVEQKG